MSQYYIETEESREIAEAYWRMAQGVPVAGRKFQALMLRMQMEFIERWYPEMDQECRSRSVDTMIYLQERITELE